MEGIGIEEQRYRQGPYNGLPVPDSRRSMPQPAPPIHGPAQSTSAQWTPHPAPVQQHSSVPLYDRPPSAQSHPPPQPYAPYPPPSRGEFTTTSSAPPFSRSNSLSTPRRSPSEVPNGGHHPLNGHVSEGPPGDYYGAGDYRNRPGYAPMELSPNGKPSHPHQPMPGPRDGLQNPPSGPPPAPPLQQPTTQPPPQHPSVYATHAPPPHQVPGPNSRVSPVTYEPPAAYWAQQMNPQQPFHPRPRGHRAQHACESCRTRKAKCDEGKPTCGHCGENNLPCHYRDLQPPKQEKNGQQQMELLTAMSEKLTSLVQMVQDLPDIKAMIHKHEKDLEKLRTSSTEGSPARSIPKDAPERMVSVTRDSPPVPVKAEGKSFSEAIEEQSILAEEIPTFPDEQHTLLPQEQQHLAISGPTSTMEGTIAPIDHTTAAHELLAWPSIRYLLRDRLPSKDYVTKGEWSRGLLRLYGWGEGANKDDTARSVASPATSVMSSTSDEQNAASSSPDISWGFGFDYESLKRDVINLSDEHPGVLGHDGKLKLDQETIDKYTQRYMEHMYILHPVLDPRRLRGMIAKFKQLYSPQKAGPSLGKRKRDSDRYPPQLDQTPRPGGDREFEKPKYGQVARTIGNAIILLVLALGRICEHRDPLPGPTKSNPSSAAATSTPTSQPATFRSSPAVSSMQNSPAMPQAMPIVDGYLPTDTSHPIRNMDVIPGLSYFAWAVGVLGEHLGGSDLEHCQAFLLASLYWGQLAHPFSSYAWIVQASSACIGLIHRSSELMANIHMAGQNVHENARIQVDLIEICFWTCLQLESDIRAELKELQPSGIAQYEQYMENNKFFPSELAIDSQSIKYDASTISEYYLFQLYLRKRLNHIHREFYDPKNRPSNKIPFIEIEIMLDELLQFRKVFKTRSWTDDQAPATDILDARLRAKFFGGVNIVIRPLLEEIMKEEFVLVDASRADGSTMGSSRSSGSQSQPHSPAVSHSKNPNRQTRQYESRLPQHHNYSQTLNHTVFPPLNAKQESIAKIGIKSLIDSTIAFDSLDGPSGKRLLVTNIFGTLHAQFGNLLILAAAAQSPRLGKFISHQELERLLSRTIKILSDHREISPTLKEDASILEIIHRNLVLTTGVGTAESFSSHSS